jgi:chromosome segregation ATPase
MDEDMQVEIAAVTTSVKNLEGTVQTMGADLTDLRGTVRRLAVKVANHDVRFDRIDEKLKKLDVLDQIKSSMDEMTGELRASRSERALFAQSFRDQQETLTNHELRLTRLERGGKPS